MQYNRLKYCCVRQIQVINFRSLSYTTKIKMGRAHQITQTKKFTLSSGAQVDDDDEAEMDEDPEAKNQLEKCYASYFYIPDLILLA